MLLGLCDCPVLSLSMFSRFIYIVAAWIRTLFLFMTNNYSIVWRAHIMFVHSFINEWTCTLNLFFFIEFEKENCMHLSAGPTPTFIPSLNFGH